MTHDLELEKRALQILNMYVGVHHRSKKIRFGELSQIQNRYILFGGRSGNATRFLFGFGSSIFLAKETENEQIFLLYNQETTKVVAYLYVFLIAQLFLRTLSPSVRKGSRKK